MTCGRYRPALTKILSQKALRTEKDKRKTSCCEMKGPKKKGGARDGLFKGTMKEGVKKKSPPKIKKKERKVREKKTRGGGGDPIQLVLWEGRASSGEKYPAER